MSDQTAAQSPTPVPPVSETIPDEPALTPEVQSKLDRLGAAFAFTPEEYDTFTKRVRFIRHLIATGRLTDDR